MEAHPSFVVASVQSAEGHQDGGSAEAQREATGDRRGDGSTVVRQAGRAGVRTLGRRLGTSVGAETPGSHSIPAASQGGRSWLGRSSCSPAQRGCLRGVRRGECGRSLPNGWLQQTNRPLRGLARVARIAVEPCVRPVPSHYPPAVSRRSWPRTVPASLQQPRSCIAQRAAPSRRLSPHAHCRIYRMPLVSCLPTPRAP